MGYHHIGLLPLFLLASSTALPPALEQDPGLSTTFLAKGGVWRGEFINFVNGDPAEVQKGALLMRISVDPEGVIDQSIALIRPDGTRTEYEGSARLRVEGNRLLWVGSVTRDENTGNPIENHRFDGLVGENQIYAAETYEEIFPDGRREKRRNNLHYVILDEETVLFLADVHVDGELLVFANTTLRLLERL